MKNLKLFLLFMIASLLLAGCGPSGIYQISLISKGIHSFSEKIEGDLIVFGGEVTLEPGSVLNGTAHIFSGNHDLDGRINGNLSIFGGDINFGDNFLLRGDLNQGGGILVGLNRSAIAGRINSGSGFQLPSVSSGKTQPAALLLRILAGAVLLGCLAVGMQRYRPAASQRIRKAALKHIQVSLAMGALAGIVGLSLIVLLAYTIILLPVAFLGLLGICAGIILGWISVGIALGQLLSRFIKPLLSPNLSAFMGTFLLFLILSGLTRIPYAGTLLSLVFACLSLGAVFLTRFGAREFTPDLA